MARKIALFIPISLILLGASAHSGEMRTFHDSGECGLEKFEKGAWTMAISGEVPDQNFVTDPEGKDPERRSFRFQQTRYRALALCFQKVARVRTEEEEENQKKLFFGFSGGLSYVTGSQARGWTRDVGIGTQTAGEFSSKLSYRALLGLQLQKTFGIYVSFNRTLADQDYRYDLNGPPPLQGKFSGVVDFRLESFSLGVQAILGRNRFRPITHLALGYSVLSVGGTIQGLTNLHKEQGSGLNIDIGGGLLVELIPHLFIETQVGFTYCDIPEMTIVSSDVPSEVGRKYLSTLDYNRLTANLGLRVEL